MRRSTTRILTTHTGSLPRPDHLMQMMIAREQGQQAPANDLADAVCSAVAETVKRQVGIGIDIISDGEMSKIGFANYVKDRLTGFGGQSQPLAPRDMLDFPDLKLLQLRRSEDGGGRNFIPACTGPISLSNKDAVHRDIANLKAALQEVQYVAHDPKQRIRTDSRVDAKGSSTRARSKGAR